MATIAAKRSWLVTGTDTEIGKTLVSTALLYALARSGMHVAGMKPIAAGAAYRNGAWHNDDVDMLAAEANVPLPVMLTTPYLLREATAPHIAARLENVDLNLFHILACFDQVRAAAEAVIVEGVGGFRVPLSEHNDTADLAQQLGLPVILVVGLRLGCLSHALLTAEAIAARGLTLAGWVANSIDPAMLYAKENVETLTKHLPAPLLGIIPSLPVPSAAAAAACLDFSRLPGWPIERAFNLGCV